MNVENLIRTARAIEDHPDWYDQAEWLNPCGTPACVKQLGEAVAWCLILNLCEESPTATVEQSFRNAFRSVRLAGMHEHPECGAARARILAALQNLDAVILAYRRMSHQAAG